jgi:hypothetical protein
MESFDNLPPAYLPVTREQFRIHQLRHYSTRRHPDSGPYGVFINWTQDPALSSVPSLTDRYLSHWNEASPLMVQILWGSSNERYNAKQELEATNELINAQINLIHGDPEGYGCIPVNNWFQAGQQLALAVRDAVIFRSTARFEDVRDFISELIENFSYPKDWRVQRFTFEQKVADRLPNSSNSYGEWWDDSVATSEPESYIRGPTARRRLRVLPGGSQRRQGLRRRPPRQNTVIAPGGRQNRVSRRSPPRTAPNLSTRRHVNTRSSHTIAPDRTRRRHTRIALQWQMLNEETPAMRELATIR